MEHLIIFNYFTSEGENEMSSKKFKEFNKAENLIVAIYVKIFSTQNSKIAICGGVSCYNNIRISCYNMVLLKVKRC